MANGRRGGSRPKGEKQAESARAKAKQRLAELVDHPDARIRLRAAQHLFSVSPERPPIETQPEPQTALRSTTSYTVADLLTHMRVMVPAGVSPLEPRAQVAQALGVGVEALARLLVDNGISEDSLRERSSGTSDADAPS